VAGIVAIISLRLDGHPAYRPATLRRRRPGRLSGQTSPYVRTIPDADPQRQHHHRMAIVADGIDLDPDSLEFA